MSVNNVYIKRYVVEKGTKMHLGISEERSEPKDDDVSNMYINIKENRVWHKFTWASI